MDNYMHTNLKYHKFPMRRYYLVCQWCIFAKYFNTANITDFKTGHRKRFILHYNDAGVYFYTRPLSDVNQLKVGVY